MKNLPRSSQHAIQIRIKEDGRICHWEREFQEIRFQINRLAFLQTHWWPGWINSDDHTNKKRKKLELDAYLLERHPSTEFWKTLDYVMFSQSAPQKKDVLQIYILKPNFRIRTQHGQIWIWKPSYVTCFRVPMSASTFSYKYTITQAFLEPQNPGVTTGSTYGLLEHSIYIIVCLFSLVCTKRNLQDKFVRIFFKRVSCCK